jgi:Putative auto-transporter adhesin, head GIN domain
MKTSFLKTAALLLMLTVARNSFAANSGSRQAFTELTWINNFHKIEIHGNVQLHLLSGEKCKVEMNSTYYNHNALAQVENGVLRITCYRTERLNVWVTVNDLRMLSAYDNVLVQTEGKFSALELEVNLFNKAKAELNLDCFCTNIKLNDRSMADISGTATESDLASNYAATLNSTNFTANQISSERIAPISETQIEFVGFRGTALLSDITGVKELKSSTGATKQIEFDIPDEVECISITQGLVN